MAIPVIEGSLATDNSTTTDISVNRAPGIVAGELLLIFIHTRTDSNTNSITTIPSGWSQVYEISNSGASRMQHSVYSRIADGTEGAVETFGRSVSDNVGSYYLRVSGAEGTDVVGAEKDSGVAATAMTVFGLTTTKDDSLIIAFGGIRSNSTTGTSTSNWSAGTSLLANISSGIFYRSMAIAGATGDMQVNFDASAKRIGRMFSISPKLPATATSAIMMGANF